MDGEDVLKPATPDDVLKMTVDEIELEALAQYARFAIRQVDNKFLKTEVRRQWQQVAKKVISIIDLQGGKCQEAIQKLG